MALTKAPKMRALISLDTIRSLAALGLKGSFLLLLFALALVSSSVAAQPNVVLVIVDDLNDWIGPYGGHPQAQTPKLDQFCEDGAVVFRNAVCPAPVCGPSRSAFLSGYMPHKTGVYGNGTNMLNASLVQQNPTLPEWFRHNGYYTLSTGKVFHGHDTANGEDKGHWAFDTYFDDNLFDTPDANHVTDSGTNTFDGTVDTTPAYASYAQTKGLAWGPTADPDLEDTKDYNKAQWAEDQLGTAGNGAMQEPFFMAVGLYKPHQPWYVTPAFLELYNTLFDSSPGAGDLANLVTPTVLSTDLNDINKANGSNLFKSQKDYDWVVANDAAHNTIKEATRAYLACVSQSDALLGKIFDAVANSDYADNTIIIVIGDHGWLLGEKLQYHKNRLWAESALTPMIVRTPETPADLQYCDNPVNLIDLYPTLIELCGLQPKPDLDGSSFAAMLADPSTDTGSVAVTVSSNGVSVLSKDWHYIENRAQNNIGSILAKELYDRNADPLEHTNRINSTNPVHLAAIDALDDHAPQTFAASVETNDGSGPNTLDATIKPARLSVDYDQDGYSSIMEQFLGTSPILPIGEDPNSSLYPRISQKSNGKLAYHYGVSTAISSFNFSHSIRTSNDLEWWAAEQATSPSSEFPSSYEFEFGAGDTRKFIRLILSWE